MRDAGTVRRHAFSTISRLIPTLALACGPVLIAIVWPSVVSTPLVLLLALGQFVGLTGVSNAAHEVVHGHFVYRSGVDRWSGRVLHGMLLLNHDVHRKYHLTHHAFLGTERDPEGVFGFGDLPNRWAYVRTVARWAVPPSPLHVFNWLETGNALAGRKGRIAKRVPAAQAAAGAVPPVMVAAALVTWLAADPVPALLVGVLPLFVTFPLYTYLTSLPEHFGLAPDARSQAGTRNVLTHPVLQYLLWNFNLHAVHHSRPGLHFSELPAAVETVEAPTAKGYVRFHGDLVRRIGTPIAPALLGARR